MAALAFVIRNHRIFVKADDFSGISVADGAIYRNGIITVALAVFGVLSAVTVENVENFFSLFQRFDDIFFIFAASVHFRLMTVIHIYSEFFNGFFKLFFEIISVSRGA